MPKRDHFLSNNEKQVQNTLNNNLYYFHQNNLNFPLQCPVGQIPPLKRLYDKDMLPNNSYFRE